MLTDREKLASYKDALRCAYTDSKIWLILPGYDFATLCAQAFRESDCGCALKPPGPAGLGDAGHGHGLLQIDDRSHGPDLKKRDWTKPYINAQMALEVLIGDRKYFLHLPTAPGVPQDMLVRLCLAAYNTGPHNALLGLLHGDPDEHTAGSAHSAGKGDYSAWVIKKRADLLVQMPDLKD